MTHAPPPAGNGLLILAAVTVLGFATLVAFPGLVPGRGVGVDVPATAVGGGTAARGGGAATEAEAPAANLSAASRPVRIALAERPYAVAGSTAQELLASMAAAAPSTEGETFFGLTVTELSFRYVHATGAGACRLHDVQVDLAVSVALPRWDPPADASYALRRDWARFAANLRRHEDRHRVLAEASADATRARLHGLTAATCAEVNVEARRRAEQARIEADAAHRRYDDETGHGRTEGAVWPQP